MEIVNPQFWVPVLLRFICTYMAFPSEFIFRSDKHKLDFSSNPGVAAQNSDALRQPQKARVMADQRTSPSIVAGI